MAQELDFSAISRMVERLDEARERIPELRRQAMEQLAPEMRQLVAAEIGSRLNDSHGLVAGWQQARIGTRYGYSAVSAIKGSYKHTHVEYPIGYVVNALENGHKTRDPSGRDKRYRPHVNVGRVSGRFFYKAAAGKLDALGKKAAEGVLAGLKKELEG